MLALQVRGASDTASADTTAVSPRTYRSTIKKNSYEQFLSPLDRSFGGWEGFCVIYIISSRECFIVTTSIIRSCIL